MNKPWLFSLSVGLVLTSLVVLYDTIRIGQLSERPQLLLANSGGSDDPCAKMGDGVSCPNPVVPWPTTCGSTDGHPIPCGGLADPGAAQFTPFPRLGECVVHIGNNLVPGPCPCPDGKICP